MPIEETFMKTKIILLITLIVWSLPAHAKLSVVVTTTDLKSVMAEVGGDFITVEAIAKGTQDPHFIEAKPSFMSKVSRADLVVAVGLDLEVGWLPNIVRGARNPKVNPGSPGYLEVGPLVNPIEVASGKVTRAEGDVHPYGNPHVHLDPIRMGQVAIFLAERLGQLDPTHADAFNTNAKVIQSRLTEKTKGWSERIAKSGVKKVVTYHKTLNYFFDRFHIENVGTLEPKPGIPPTTAHILKIIDVIREKKVPLILVENFFDPTVTKKIREEVPSVRSATVPVDVEGESGIATLDDLYEKLVRILEGK
jgi:zinc/manganese transport system substrate-binding protein